MEFPALGKRCAYEECAQLDFLPLDCFYCRLVFCKEHHLPTDHACVSCTDNIVWSPNIKGTETWQYRCSHPECRVKELVPIHCIRCKRHFCLNHRHFDQHECIRERESKASSSVPTGLQIGKQLQAKVTDDINAKLEAAKAAGGHKAAMATKLTLMKLKARARGDNAIPRTERIFFIVEYPNRQQNSIPLDLFMGTTWTIGKAIDFVSKEGSIKNKNHLPNGPFLHLFKGETCLSKPFEKTIQELVTENILKDGDSLSLRYA